MKSTNNKSREQRERRAKSKRGVTPAGMIPLKEASATLGVSTARIKNNKDLVTYLDYRLIDGKGYVSSQQVSMFQAMIEGLVSHKEAALRIGMSGRTLHDHKRVKKLLAERRIMGWAYYSAEKIAHYKELFFK